jgi:hypothetical protein
MYNAHLKNILAYYSALEMIVAIVFFPWIGLCVMQEPLVSSLSKKKPTSEYVQSNSGAQRVCPVRRWVFQRQLTSLGCNAVAERNKILHHTNYKAHGASSGNSLPWTNSFTS